MPTLKLGMVSPSLEVQTQSRVERAPTEGNQGVVTGRMSEEH